MFKKPLATLKSFSPLRSSDRRKFQNETYEAYPSLKEKCTQENKHLMPDTLQCAKFTSHIDQPGTVYVADNKPLWIKLLDLPPIPTVYTLWEYPNILPTLYTWGPVVRKLMDGADLMIPGLVSLDGTLPNVNQGDLVAIAVKGYKFPLAIGTMALSSSDIKIRSGMKGKAVLIIHVYQDFLWSMGDKSDPPEMKELSDDDDDIGERDEEEEKEHNEENNEDNADQQENLNISTPESATNKQQQQNAFSKNYTTSEIDELLKKSLYQGLLFKLTKEKATSVLPISASSLYTAYILPSRPRDGGMEVDIKKSSWKKLQKFLKVMEKSGLLKVKEQRGESSVTSINWSHPSLQNLSSYKTVESIMDQQHQNAANNNDQQQNNKSSTNAENSISAEQIQITDLYKPTDNSLIALFNAAKHDTSKLYTAQEIRQVILDYIKIENLVDPKNQKMIIIDPLLTDAILNKSEYQTINKLGRDQIIQRLLPKMQPFHLVTLPNKEPVLKKGNPKSINVIQEIRQGRKTVTKMTGMEAFGLEIDDLCKELTKLCASSATSNQIHGTSPKAPLYEIMVQGPQIKNISELLLKKGVPKKFVLVDDKTSKKGKNKK